MCVAHACSVLRFICALECGEGGGEGGGWGWADGTRPVITPQIRGGMFFSF